MKCALVAGSVRGKKGTGYWRLCEGCSHVVFATELKYSDYLNSWLKTLNVSSAACLLGNNTCSYVASKNIKEKLGKTHKLHALKTSRNKRTDLKLGENPSAFFNVVIPKLKLLFLNTEKCVRGGSFACFLRHRKQNRKKKYTRTHTHIYTYRICWLYSLYVSLLGHFEMI